MAGRQAEADRIDKNWRHHRDGGCQLLESDHTCRHHEKGHGLETSAPVFSKGWFRAPEGSANHGDGTHAQAPVVSIRGPA